jgi:site-specific DNA-methyltransferase (adenine-specific)
MPIHDVCSLFPPMTPEEFAGLKADIAAHGQREPITTHRGVVIDGRNRLRACLELGIEPRSVEWDGAGSLVGLVASLNLHRRHLTNSQRATVAAEIRARAAEERNITSPPPTAKEAALIVGVSPSYVDHAASVRKKDPEAFERVKSGEMTLPQARRHVDRCEKRRELETLAETARIARADPSAPPPWTIRHGDCLDILREIEPGTVRLIFADPPYNSGAADGSLWVLISHEYADHYGLLLREAGLHRREWLTWYESFGVNVPGGFNRTSRALLHCIKSTGRFVFHADPVSRPSDRQAKYDDPRADPGGKTWDDVWGINPPIPRLVGTARERLPDFPTQLPVDLLLPIVGCASDPGDLVVDPFSGSATTGVACLKLGRRYLGADKSAEYVRLSRMRLAAVEGGLL